MTSATDILVDERGHVMFHCALCGEPMTRGDFFDQAMRLPDRGEGPDDYCDAELIDRFEHARCAERARAPRAG
jgi:hypothetical protein